MCAARSYVSNEGHHYLELKVKRGGPLVEYKRQIAAGKLKDGDERQVLKKLQEFFLSSTRMYELFL